MKYTLLTLCLGFVVSLLISPLIISLMKKLKGEQSILEYVDMHAHKKGTPTMGGAIFVIGLIVSFLPLINGYNRLSTLVLCSTIGFAILGFLDDFIKVKFKQNLGLRPYQKIIGQVGISIIVAVFVYLSPIVGSGVKIPFSDISVDFFWLIIPFVIFILIAMTNSVNLTDGLDGLAAGVSVAYLVGFIGILAISVTRMENAGESLVMIKETQNLLYLCGGFMGALIAFLISNGFPAKVFMGDTGSLAIGAFLATSAIVSRQYLLIPILGFMFVMSAVSVIIQVLVYKKTKKRIFLMAPLHHHFEKKGCYETKIVTIYIIVTLMISITSVILYL